VFGNHRIKLNAEYLMISIMVEPPIQDATLSTTNVNEYVAGPDVFHKKRVQDFVACVPRIVRAEVSIAGGDGFVQKLAIPKIGPRASNFPHYPKHR
jgi:hypothetical protein